MCSMGGINAFFRTEVIIHVAISKDTITVQYLRAPNISSNSRILPCRLGIIR
jgi:hypothetical protein